MTIDRIFSPFRSDGTPLAKVISGFWLHAVLACAACASLMVMRPDHARAMQALGMPATSPQMASMQAVARCMKPGATCVGPINSIAFFADPTDPNITSLNLELTFDATLYTFDTAASGPLCNFATGGAPCPASTASLGTLVIPVDNTMPGEVPEGATLTFTVTPLLPLTSLGSAAAAAPGDIFDLLTVDYTNPAGVDLTNDQNVLELVFDLATPVPADVPLTATYFGTPGNHQFNQVAFSCDGSSMACSGVPNVAGVDVAVVPEPASATILGVALTVFGLAGRNARRRHPRVFPERAGIRAR